MVVRKVKTAFLFYQGDQLSNIRTELGVSMGEAMTEVCFVSFRIVIVWHRVARFLLGSQPASQQTTTNHTPQQRFRPSCPWEAEPKPPNHGEIPPSAPTPPHPFRVSPFARSLAHTHISFSFSFSWRVVGEK